MIRINSILLWAALFVLPLFLNGQSSELSERDQRRFDAHFFEAERYKQIERYEEAYKNYYACYKLDPENATVVFEMGRMLRKASKNEEALRYLEEAHKLDADNRWISVELAGYYQELGMNEAATKIYKQLVEENPDNLNYKYDLAQLYFATKQYKSCLKVLDDIEDRTGVNVELINQKKDIYLLLNDEKGAEKEIKKLVDAFPANIDYKGALARFYLANDAYDKAIAIYREMIAMAPDDPRAHLDLANIYRSQGSYDSSYYHLKIAMASTSLDIDNKIQVLYSFYQQGDRDSVMRKMGYELLKICLETTPNEPKLYAMRGDYFLRDNKYLEARNDLRKATRLGANQLQLWSQVLLLDAQLQLNDSLAVDGEVCVDLYPNQPLGYLMAGSGYALSDNPKKATELLEAGLDYVIDNPELEEQFYVSLADAYHRLENHKESDRYFDKALEINPRNPSTLNNYAFYLAVRGVRLDNALEMTETCNSLSPNNGVFLDTWAWVLYQKGSYQQALDKIEDALQFGGDASGEVLEHYGDILFKLGRVDDAVAAWKRAATKPDATKAIQQKIKTKSLNE